VPGARSVGALAGAAAELTVVLLLFLILLFPDGRLPSRRWRPVAGALFVVAVATLAAAALFTPLRSRVQHLVDRKFNRTRYDADQTLTAFAARLKDAVDQDAVRADLLGVVHRSLEPTHAAVWLPTR
jgi:hypothetical protein